MLLSYFSNDPWVQGVVVVGITILLVIYIILAFSRRKNDIEAPLLLRLENLQGRYDQANELVNRFGLREKAK